MVVSPEILAIVPARGGSRSIPGKNMRLLAGHPLLAYSIAAGLQSERATRVIVSTDDEEIAEVARRYGAEIPFLRPPELALDDTPDLPVFQHALKWLSDQDGYRPDIVIQLRPTSPFRPPNCVDRAIAILEDNPEADSVRGVALSGQNPYKMWRIGEEGRLSPLLTEGLKEAFNMPRQALPATYWQTGHMDAIRTETITEKASMSGDTILPLLLDSAYSVDIDTEWQWEQAEWLVLHAERPMVRPGRNRRPLPDQISLLVMDFDGVFTDNRVWVDSDGRELVVASRADGMGLSILRQTGVKVVVLSSETDPVVAARCRKLDLPLRQGVFDKELVLRELLNEHTVDPAQAVYLGNDVNDIPCFELVGCAVVVADAHPKALERADLILRRSGGQGAIRELCDLILEPKLEKEAHG